MKSVLTTSNPIHFNSELIVVCLITNESYHKMMDQLFMFDYTYYYHHYYHHYLIWWEAAWEAAREASHPRYYFCPKLRILLRFIIVRSCAFIILIIMLLLDV